MLDKTILMNYAGFIFDMDGTLIDTMPSHANAWEKVGEVLGYPIKSDIMYQLAGSTTAVIAREMMRYGNIPDHYFEEIIRLKREFGYEMVKENATLLPTFDIVHQYYGKLPLALGTGSHRAMVDMLDQKFALNRYFDAIVCSDDVTRHKPDPETFLLCADKINVPATRCLVFEDGDLGIDAAIAGGMDVIDVRVNRLIKADTRR